MSGFGVEIVTPNKSFKFSDVSYLRFTGLDGKVGVMKNHAPAIMAVDVGELKIEDSSGKIKYFATTGGFTEVIDNKSMILVEAAESSDRIDLDRAKAAKERAEDRIKSKNEDLDLQRAEFALYRAINRIQVAKNS
ncbi:MAG: F0F1 ATP synthase subunit epsilon [Calditrichaeota bacterium]|nr:MAG: F0F1 ATP synthase subunit epsilon [Calditrichota bacterium]